MMVTPPPFFHLLVASLAREAELSEMFDIAPDEMVVVVVPIAGRKATYRILPDSAEVCVCVCIVLYCIVYFYFQHVFSA